VTKAISTAQQKVEGYNFDIRKHVVEYDDVMNMHRKVIYEERQKILEGADVRANVQEMVEEELAAIVDAHVGGRAQEEWDLASMIAQLTAILPLPPELNEETLWEMTPEEMRERVIEHGRAAYERKIAEFEPAKGLAPFGDDPFGFVERQVLLQTIDVLWVEHLTAMEEMREGIGLQAYGQNDPLVMYKREGHDMFEQLKGNIRNLVARNILHQQLTIRQGPPPQTSGSESPAAVGNGAQPAEAPAPVPAAAPPGAAARPAPRLRENREAPLANGSGNGARNGAAGRPAPALIATKTPGRNDPCYCGSGMKYKKCHGKLA
jgi:preprotein translocase subunit SecA